MATLSVLIDDILERLHDDGTLFSRAEILRWLNEGYRFITNQTRHAKTFTAFDLPPRHTRAITHDWEEKTLGSGSFRKWTFTHQNGVRECTFLWEAQQADGLTPSAQLKAVSQLWEMSVSEGRADAHFRFMLPRNESVIHMVWHDQERLTPVTIRALDSFEDKWWTIDGEPFHWSQQLGPANSFEIFEIDNIYRQSSVIVTGKRS